MLDINQIISKLILKEDIVLDLLDSSLIESEQLLITYCNQHCFNTLVEDQLYTNTIADNFEVFVDGYGMIKAYNFLFNTQFNSFNATDLYNKFLILLSQKDIPVFLIGGKFSDELLENNNQYNVNIVGYQNGYFELSSIENIAQKIRKANSRVVLIGMGVPKQEIFAKKLSEFFTDKLFLCVGNYLEYYLGTSKRIPFFFRNKGIEWIYRLLQEPKRLWKRYLIGIPLFIFRVLKEKYRK
ncbi:MAG: WecB/TagA/CpsF family glycosyltransferase [Melioribacteraceae bacterium]|nr:MAG: WecB/TagA/CpsF family glycosyltransferase [Melioribacteraceae bacterium]